MAKPSRGLSVAADGYLKISLENGKLLAVEDEGASDLGALDRTTFRLEQLPSLKLIFQIEDGKVTGLTLDEGDGNPMRLEKRGVG